MTCPARAVGDSSPLTLRLKLGEEYDTNARRVEGESTRADLVTRLFMKLTYAVRTDSRNVLVISVRSGGKLYAEFNEENTLLNQIDLLYTLDLPDPFQWQLWGTFKDRTEEVHHWDYLRGSAMTGPVINADDFHVRVGGGYSLFMFKPDEDIYNSGPGLEASISWSPNDLLSVSLSSMTTWKYYLSPVRIETEEGIDYDAERERSDILAAIRLGFQFRGPFFAQAAYTYLLNDSNSYGQSLDRHGFQVVLTVPILVDLIAGLRLTLQRTSYDNPFIIDPTFGIDEENRNGVELSLSYAFTEMVGLEMKVNFFSQELGEGRDYDRKLWYLGFYLTP